MTLAQLYGSSLSLLTDLYQLTMAYGYWRSGQADTQALFHLFFRQNPFRGGYAVACGLSAAMELMETLSFGAQELSYLGELKGNDGAPLFESGFLDYLSQLRFECDVEAMPEGTVAFPHEPLMRVRGPLIQAQLLETALLTIINFQTLIATKASRVKWAAQGDTVLEFGLRRAQGIDGGVSASRAAYVGGADATSNVLAGKLYGIPVRGTHAHSWVMCFDSEQEAFERYAQAMPNNCVFLVDTYDTLEGVRRAIEVGHGLRARGYELAGVRLDSGDLAWLSVKARELLDAAGFTQAQIVASNDLSEDIITSLKLQGARIDVWGVGTKLSTAYDQPALGGVYKLSAVRHPGGDWQDRVKLSEQAIKVSTPGMLRVRRFFGPDGLATGDMIYDERHDPGPQATIIDPMDMTRRKRLDASNTTRHEELLVEVFRGGQRVYQAPDLHAARQRAQAQLGALHAGIRRLQNPHQHPVGLEQRLHEHKTALILKARGFDPDATPSA